MPNSDRIVAPFFSTDIVCSSCGHPLISTFRSDHLDTVGPDGAVNFTSHRLVPGTLLADRYRIGTLIGQGGMGEVYQADDLTLEQAVALKFLPPELQTDRAALARLHREVSLSRQISHPNVCRVFDIGYADGLAFITMEFVGGEDLRSLLERIGRLAPDKALDVARQLCAGLAAAHDAGVLHRDLKPANVMLDRRGNVRVTDFGLAASAGEAGAATVGTPVYMAPEQLRGQKVSVRTDLYALGLVLHEIFTGKPPFVLESLAEIVRQPLETGLKPALERVIWRCLEFDPENRPVSALQVAADLADAVGSGSAVVPPTSVAFSDRNARIGWSAFLITLAGMAGLLVMALPSAVKIWTFHNSSSAVLFTWCWCIAFQILLGFLSIGFLVRQSCKAS